MAATPPHMWSMYLVTSNLMGAGNTTNGTIRGSTPRFMRCWRSVIPVGKRSSLSELSSLDTAIDLQTAIECPREHLAAWAPKTVVWAPGGTRRHAIASGVPLDDSYIGWAWEQHMRCIELFFALGVQTLFAPILG